MLQSSRCFLFTPTNWQLIQVPTAGAITVPQKFNVPVKNANIVPSIFGGVILANSERIGNVNRRVLRTLKITSVNIRKNISSISTSRFHRLAKAKLRRLPSTEQHIAKISMFLVSTFLHQALQISAPTRWHIQPIRTKSAKMNLETPITFIRKK